MKPTTTILPTENSTFPVEWGSDSDPIYFNDLRDEMKREKRDNKKVDKKKRNKISKNLKGKYHSLAKNKKICDLSSKKFHTFFFSPKERCLRFAKYRKIKNKIDTIINKHGPFLEKIADTEWDGHMYKVTDSEVITVDNLFSNLSDVKNTLEDFDGINTRYDNMCDNEIIYKEKDKEDQHMGLTTTVTKSITFKNNL